MPVRAHVLPALALLLIAGCSSPEPRARPTTRIGPWENETGWRAGYERRRAARQRELDDMQATLEARASARQDYAAANRGKRPDDVLDALAAASVAIGMTHEELLLVVHGAAVRRTATAEGVGEVWELGDIKLTLRDAKLVAWSAPGTDPTLSKTLPIAQPVVPPNDAY